MFEAQAISNRNRYLVLDGLRGVAAVSVMIYHLTSHRSLHFLDNAPIAVDFFFILSGFVITHSYGARLKNNMSVFEYISRRLVRLYPMLILGTLIGAPVLYLLMEAGFADFSKRELVRSLLYNGLFLPYFTGDRIQILGSSVAAVGEVFPADPPEWSLFFELIASLAFVGLLRMEKKSLICVIVISFAILVLTGLGAHGLDLDQGWGTFNFVGGVPRVLFGFTFGVVLHKFANTETWITGRNFVRRYFRSPWFLYFLLIAIFAVPTTWSGLYPALVIAIVAPSLVFIGSAMDCHNSFDTKAARFFGWISYPVYCLHFPIGRAVFFLADGGHYSLAMTVFISVAMTFAAVAVLTKFYEEPMRAYLSRKLLTTSKSTMPLAADNA
jgi:peptidoglycan/LPS O-acetylase OafA/YrhL